MGTASEYTLRRILDAINQIGLWDQAGIQQILYTDFAAGTSTTLYTTPSDKTFYLTSIYLMAFNDSSWDDDPYMHLWDPVTMGSMIEWRLYVRVGGQAHLALSFPTPIRVPAGWEIRISSAYADSEIWGTITGFEL